MSNVDFISFIENSNQAKTIDQLFGCVDVFSSELGLDRVLYSLMTDHPSINQKAGHGVVRSYPEDWMDYYFEQGYENIDPVRRYIMTWRDGPFFWEQLGRVYTLSAAEQRVLDEAREAKLLDGIAVPLHGPGGEIAAMGFASSSGQVEVDKDRLALLNAVANQFALVYKSLISSEKRTTCSDVHLTVREKEVLTWVAKGKRNADIAEILKLSEHGVDFHLRNIFKKLNVTSRVTAVVKAIRLCLIQPG